MIPATAALTALRGRWKLIAGLAVLAALAIALAVQTARIDGFGIWPLKTVGLKEKYETAVALLADERAGRKADRIAYANAQTAAAALNKAQVARIEVEQERITADVAQDYTSDLARLRAELGRVRAKDAPAAQRPAGGAQASQDGNAPARAYGDGVPIPTSDDLPAAEIELRLMHLQDWVEEQAKVER